MFISRSTSDGRERAAAAGVLPFSPSPHPGLAYALTLAAMLAIDPLLTPGKPWGSIRHC